VPNSGDMATERYEQSITRRAERWAAILMIRVFRVAVTDQSATIFVSATAGSARYSFRITVLCRHLRLLRPQFGTVAAAELIHHP